MSTWEELEGEDEVVVRQGIHAAGAERRLMGVALGFLGPVATSPPDAPMPSAADAWYAPKKLRERLDEQLLDLASGDVGAHGGRGAGGVKPNGARYGHSHDRFKLVSSDAALRDDIPSPVEATGANEPSPTGKLKEHQDEDHHQKQSEQAQLPAGLENRLVADDLMGKGFLDLVHGTLLRDATSKEAAAAAVTARFESSEPGARTVLPPQIRPQVDPQSIHFEPDTYLSCFHRESDRADFEKGSRALKAILSEKEKDMQSIVCRNFHLLLMCNETMNEVKDQILGTRPNLRPTESSELFGGYNNNAAKVELALNRAERIMSELYSSVMEKQRYIQRLVRARAILQKSRFVFEFPERLRHCIERDDLDTLADDYRAVKDWLHSQEAAGSQVIEKIKHEIQLAVRKFRQKLNEAVVNPYTDPEALRKARDFLDVHDPRTDHAARMLLVRQEKALEGIRRIRGAVAAEVIMRARLQSPSPGDASESAIELMHSEAMASVTHMTQKLTGVFVEGLNFFWSLVCFFHPEEQGEQSSHRLHLVMSELISEYCDTVLMVLLPSYTRHAVLISRESAAYIVNTLHEVQKIGVPHAFMGPLYSITDQIVEAYCMSIVKSMKNVAIELGRSADIESGSMCDQVQTLVLEALHELKEVVTPESATASLARNACIKAPVEAARAFRVRFLAPNSELGAVHAGADSAQWMRKLLLLITSVHHLRERVIPLVGGALSDSLGGESFAPVVNQAVSSLRSIEREIVDRFLHVKALPLVTLVTRGAVVGGAVRGELLKPRAYTWDLITELALLTAQIDAVAVPSIRQTIVDGLKTVIGNAFRDALREVEMQLTGTPWEQLALEVEFVARVMVPPKSKGTMFVAARELASAYIETHSAEYELLLRSAVDTCELEQRSLS
ncbi:Exocyst complex component SEC5B [Porphyridium purpureum]|uniref:Exocyst complex component n=1 Tax=Porphyridium purpureum TaxID=35688 RepID=A0A5J4YUA1_PORPP|nr:Exocyst complex component SEC5B [Porphyridium purpureum]|eukprot:POR5177..scf227_4